MKYIDACEMAFKNGFSKGKIETLEAVEEILKDHLGEDANQILKEVKEKLSEVNNND